MQKKNGRKNGRKNRRNAARIYTIIEEGEMDQKERRKKERIL